MRRKPCVAFTTISGDTWLFIAKHDRYRYLRVATFCCAAWLEVFCLPTCFLRILQKNAVLQRTLRIDDTCVNYWQAVISYVRDIAPADIVLTFYMLLQYYSASIYFNISINSIMIKQTLHFPILLHVLLKYNAEKLLCGNFV